MKKQLKRIKGKRLITGDTNLMTKHEICINTTSDGRVEVKELGTDGKIKDLTSGGGGSSKEYDDLHTFLYYDDRMFSFNNVEVPLCAFIAEMVGALVNTYPEIDGIVKINNTEDIFGISWGNYIPLKGFFASSGDFSTILPSIKGISIPKYVLPEYFSMNSSGIPNEADKIDIFDLVKVVFGEPIGEGIKDMPTITREEFFDLLK